MRAVDWGWRHAGGDAPAVAGLSLTIEPGERVLVVGASGAGKSTLLAGIAGVLGDDEDGDETGMLTIDDVPAREARGACGLVLQDPDSQVMLARVGDDIAFGCENLAVPRDEIWQRVAVAKAAVGLDVPDEHPTNALSGGQQQRLALAGVLAMRPGALLLDEPTANLDPSGTRDVVASVRRIADDGGLTVVVVEHRVDVWAPHVDRLVVVGPSGIVHDGPLERVVAEHGDELVAAGVWLPGRPVEIAPRARAESRAQGTDGQAPETPSSPGEALLEARDLEIGWRGAAPLQRDLNVTVRSGHLLAIVGPNGSGKSTLAMTLGGLHPPLAGEVLATPALAEGLGADVRSWRSKHLITRIGTVFQQPEHQFVARTVRDEIAVGLRALRRDRDDVDARVDDMLRGLGLVELADASPFELSGGQQRRLSVATVLATRPRVIVLDEPTFGQDRRTWRHMVDRCAALLDDGCAIVAVSHDSRFVAALASETLELARIMDAGGQAALSVA
nr:ATP-binding cassette domain-containing protein [Pseudoclavibacter endophyticus]